MPRTEERQTEEEGGQNEGTSERGQRVNERAKMRDKGHEGMHDMQQMGDKETRRCSAEKKEGTNQKRRNYGEPWPRRYGRWKGKEGKRCTTNVGRKRQSGMRQQGKRKRQRHEYMQGIKA
jgi:hypothetical protein